jgi:hypothetical protein
MVCNTQNYWVLDFFLRPVFYRIENTTFLKMDLFNPRPTGHSASTNYDTGHPHHLPFGLK